MTEPSEHTELVTSDVTGDVPVAEIPAVTRREECRAAMAVVAGLRDCGVPERDIVVVARDLDRYEEPLTRAAIRYGVTPVFWTQIDLVTTRPYQLIIALCELFGTRKPTLDVLFRPLELGWTPPDSTGEWPIAAETVTETVHKLPDDSRPVDAWQTVLADAPWMDTRITEFVEWVATTPDPTPETINTVLGGVSESYRESVLPKQWTADSPALLETETAARAVVRMEQLVEQVESKYAQRLADGWADESWATVAGICESIATQRPGRREHANALALDVLEANDIWARTIPFVIAVGLVEGDWPRQPESVMPMELRHAITTGTGPAERLSPRTAWMGGRDHDQFVDTHRAATAGLVLTRHTQDDNGDRRVRSSLVAGLGVDRVSETARTQLLSTDVTLPDAVRSMLPASGDTASEGIAHE